MTWTLSAFADEAGESVDTQIDALKQAGFKHIDLRTVDGINISELPLDHARAVKGKLDAAGIRVNMFGSPLGKIDIADDFAIDQRKLEHLAKLSKVLDCRAIRIFSYYNKKQATMDVWQNEALSRLKKLSEQAAGENLVLYHENEAGIFGDHCKQVLVIAQTLRSVAGIGSSSHGGAGSFGLIFDFDNYNRGGDNVWENWTQLKDYTDAFHLKDSNSQGHHVPIGMGSGQAERILADAVACGWRGPLSVEPHLKHSKAVLATHPGTPANQAFADKDARECFQIATQAAKALLKKLAAPIA